MAIKDWPGGVISKTPVVPGPTGASGVWTLDQVAYWAKQSAWPYGPSDPYYDYVSLLLTGNGTNGAQNNTFLDSSTNNFTITRNGNTTQGTFSPYGNLWSNYFDGSGDYLTWPSGASVQFGTGDFTVEGWIYLNVAPAGQYIIDARDASNTGTWVFGFGLSGVSNGKLGFYDGATLIEQSSATITAQSFAHVIAVRSGSTLSVYINGNRVATATNTRNISATPATSYIANRYSGTGYELGGYISNLRIVKGTAVYDPSQSTITVPTTPLTAISGTSLLTCQSNVICDTSSNKFAITTNGNAAVNNKSPFTISSTYNQYSFSGYFDGTGDYLTAPANGAFDMGSGDFTVECWVNPQTTTTSGIVRNPNSSSYSGFAIGWESSKFKILISYNGSSWAFDTASSSTYSTNSWYHLALVRNGSTVVLYINGTSAISVNVSTNSLYGGQPIYIGYSRYSSEYFNGYISNTRIVKGTAVYTSNFTPSNEPLTAISGTSLLTCQSSTFVDNSPNNFTITVNGNTTVATASNSGLPITRNGNTTQGTFSPYGNLWSNYFDGSGDYITAPASSAFQPGTGDFSSECWFYCTTTSTAGLIGTNYTGASPNTYVVITLNRNTSGSNVAGAIIGQLSDVSSIAGTAGAVFSNSTWNHVVLCRTGTTLSLFLNGIRIGTATNSTNVTPNIQFEIGNTSALNRPFAGYVSNARFIKGSGPYDATQTTITVPTAPLTAITNTSLLCNFTNAGIPDAAMMNDLETVGNAQVSTSVKKYGTGSLAFDGTGDYLYGANGKTAQSGGDFTVEFWAYPTSFADWKGIIGVGTTGASHLCIRTNAGGYVQFWLNTPSNIVTSSSTLSLNTWTHIALVRSGSASNNIKLYINGTSVAQTTSTYTIPENPIVVGRSYDAYDGEYFNGYIDDLRITKGYARYTSSFTPPTAAFPTY